MSIYRDAILAELREAGGRIVGPELRKKCDERLRRTFDPAKHPLRRLLIACGLPLYPSVGIAFFYGLLTTLQDEGIVRHTKRKELFQRQMVDRHFYELT